MSPSKDERRAKAEFDKAVKKAREINSLSLVCLRSASLLTVLIRQRAEWKAAGRDFTAEYDRAMQRTEANESSELVALTFFFYASLHTVIEGWRDPNQAEPRLADEKIDEILKSEHVPTLGDFRNAVLHPNSLLDKRLVAFMSAHSEILPWAMSLIDEFRRYFREWRESIGARAQAERDARNASGEQKGEAPPTT